MSTPDLSLDLPQPEEDTRKQVVEIALPDGAPAPEPAAGEQQLSAEDVAADLKRQIAARDAELARTRAENARLLGETRQARGQAADSTLVALSNDIELREKQLDGLESELAEAHAAGDYAKVAKIQRNIAREEGRLDRLRDEKTSFEAGYQPDQRGRPHEGRVPSAPVDPSTMTLDQRVEDLAGRLSADEGAWLRAHKDVMNRPEELAAAYQFGIHRKGLQKDSPELFRYLEQELGLSAPEAAPAAAAVPAPSGQRQAAREAIPAAPVARPTPSLTRAPTARTVKVELDSKQLDAARRMDMTPEEYAHFLHSSN